MKYLLFLLALALAGCASLPRSGGSGGTEDPSAGASLASMGEVFLWVGGIALVGGVAARIWFGPLGTLIAELGGLTLAAGLAFIWIGDNLWLAIAGLALTALAFLYRHRARVLRWLRIGKTPNT
jgi:hypothetical protein